MKGKSTPLFTSSSAFYFHSAHFPNGMHCILQTLFITFYLFDGSIPSRGASTQPVFWYSVVLPELPFQTVSRSLWRLPRLGELLELGCEASMESFEMLSLLWATSIIFRHKNFISDTHGGMCTISLADREAHAYCWPSSFGRDRSLAMSPSASITCLVNGVHKKEWLY